MLTSRLSLVALCALAVSVSLGVALVSISKALVVLALVVSLPQLWRNRSLLPPRKRYWTPWLILTALAWMTLSALWTSASPAEVGTAWVRHARLLVLPVTLLLLGSRQDAHKVLRYLVLAQILVVIGSCLLFLGVPLPTTDQNLPFEKGILFSSHLEQPVMSTLMLIVVWHLHSVLAPTVRSWVVWVLVLLTLVNVLFLITGGSGFIAMLLAIAMTIWLSAKRRWRLWGMLAFVLFALGVGLTSAPVQTRLSAAAQNISKYAKGSIGNPEAFRLDYWHHSVRALLEKPMIGHGIGSWKTQYVRSGGTDNDPPSNPHNQYLLWAVEGGLIGMALMVAILVALYRDANQLEPPAKRALLSTLAIVVVLSFFNCPFFGAGMGEFLLLLLSALLAAGRQEDLQPTGQQAPLSTTAVTPT